MLSKQSLIKYGYAGCLLLGVTLSGCTKYAPAENIADAAYIRVFNSITAKPDPIDGGAVNPFLTFLIDPVTDQHGTITGAPVMCDYLNTRQLFSASYPMDAGTAPDLPTTVNTGVYASTTYYGPLNFEYPGKYHVPAAPAMNGFDMSSWAQIKPGRHRIVFVARPKNSVDFGALNEGIRKSVLIDTTVDLKPGEVYTLQATQTSIDNPARYGLYMRTEDFYKQSFDDNKIYVGFDNISGKNPLAADYGYIRVFSDTLDIFYSYLMKDVINTTTIALNPVAGLDNLFFTTIPQKQPGKIGSYLSIPMLPRSNFFYKDGSLKTYPGTIFLNASNGAQKDEDLPFVKFSLYNNDGKPASSLLDINCSANPVTLPFYDQNSMYVRRYLPNLNLILNRNNKVYIYPTVNILEVCYDRVYMMQMQRAFNQVPQ